ncbi:ATP-grasp fold amidoligase family protein [Kytococcus sp. Marseille-QA3725]
MIRRAVRSLPPVRNRDLKIAELREQLRTSKAEANDLRRRVRATEKARRVAEERLERSNHLGRVVRDRPGAMPRVRLGTAVLERLRAAGFRHTGGTAKEDARSYASFVTKLFEVRRYTYIVRRLGAPHPRPEVANKLRTLALAASHGVGIPTIHGLWEDAREIDLAPLPDEFVLKANHGAGSRGVVPVRRVPGEPDTYRLTDDTDRVLSGAEVIAWVTKDNLSGPWYAEELLVGDDGSGGIPHDYKLYCFYGEVAGGFVRRAGAHFGVEEFADEVRFHYFDGEGKDHVWRQERVDQSIPLSPQLPEILRSAQLLSTVVPLPFIRVDLYATTRGVVMGELTLGPGGAQYLRAEEDVRFGRMWDAAQVRLETDLFAGERPYDMVVGDHPVPELLQPYLPRR